MSAAALGGASGMYGLSRTARGRRGRDGGVGLLWRVVMSSWVTACSTMRANSAVVE
jgi:hypothetical protein